MSNKTLNQHARGFRSDLSRGRGKLLELRDKLDISQAELAARIGMSKISVSVHESRGTLPKNAAVRANLRALAATAGVEIE